jgi:hypothetical protein
VVSDDDNSRPGSTFLTSNKPDLAFQPIQIERMLHYMAIVIGAGNQETGQQVGAPVIFCTKANVYRRRVFA